MRKHGIASESAGRVMQLVGNTKKQIAMHTATTTLRQEEYPHSVREAATLSIATA